MDLYDYLRVLRRNWILILASLLAGLLVAGAATILVRPTYTSSTQLFVAIQSSGSVAELQQGNTFSQARVQSYVKTVTTPVVLQPAINALGLDETPATLASRIRASSDPNTVLIDIEVEDASPVQAAAIAQAVADSLIKGLDALERPKAGGTSPVSLSVIAPATAPSSPSSPNTRLNLLLGLFAGLLVGVGLAVLRTALDHRIRGEADFRRSSDAPVLGAIAFDRDAIKKPLLTQTGTQSPRAESFRQLRTNLQFANVTGRGKSILMTSSLPGEGKSTTATNLALALAQAGQTVCLIDADLRRPMVSDYLGLDRNAGLTTALVGRADVSDLLQPWGVEPLYVLTSGQIPPNPSELLGSAQMTQLLKRLEDSFDAVIIDAPPLLPVTDAAVLAQHVGGVVLVVGAQKLKTQDLEKSLETLELIEAHLLGVVLNRLPQSGPDAYTYSYYSSDDSLERGRISAESTNTARKASLNSEEDFHADESPEGRPPSVFPGLPR
ncbi:polysaccharide biosynthesis tyrosine autokinase [Arthrobacter sp. NQ4]|uniref:polysaccharide biosynthesis tyrosine autokinase n=1 Tax=Arthrobacter sp. NQ4 TaxID=3027930 RepID=UPI0023B1ED0F|nr:polysaccharide biosynthesis tyrosine autokinase [Arthrobacter sp. NQ4]MDE8585920.1 polysaccharide biosynthesis tyrosine autokinase [Arthrobacter sp. NQ4]